jgi:hypothetical protein
MGRRRLMLRRSMGMPNERHEVIAYLEPQGHPRGVAAAA